MKLFSPILAGATLKERLFACLGAALGICTTGLVCALSLGHTGLSPVIVAPMGASAVLLFAVPASPLAQPWPAVGGNVISALTGVTIAKLVPEPALAIGLAVSLAILIMSLTRTLHPPGGAAALTAVVGGPAVAAAGFWFPFVPVAINSLVLVGLAWLFHRLSGHAYPHRPVPAPANTHGTADAAPAQRVGFNRADIDAALAEMHETFDIDSDDLDALLRGVEARALLRQHGDVRCRDVMSRDVISISADGTAAAARQRLLDHNIRVLPVIAADGKLVGTVGLRELMHSDDEALPISGALTAAQDDPVVGLIPKLNDGSRHAAVIVEPDGRVAGIISQTDLLAALARLVSISDATQAAR